MLPEGTNMFSYMYGPESKTNWMAFFFFCCWVFFVWFVCLFVFSMCVCFVVLFASVWSCSITLRECVAGPIVGPKDLQGICEGKSCCWTLQGGVAHTWHGLVQADCWDMAGKCYPSSHIWALVQSMQICTVWTPSPASCRSELQWCMADQGSVLGSAPWTLFPLGCRASAKEWTTEMLYACCPKAVCLFLVPSLACPGATCCQMAEWCASKAKQVLWGEHCLSAACHKKVCVCVIRLRALLL